MIARPESGVVLAAFVGFCVGQVAGQDGLVYSIVGAVVAVVLLLLLIRAYHREYRS